MLSEFLSNDSGEWKAPTGSSITEKVNGSWIWTWTHFFFNFFPFSPQSRTVHSCIFLVVGPSSCGMWDAASAWFDEQCHVRAQDSNQRNTVPPAAEHVNLTTRPPGQPQGGADFWVFTKMPRAWSRGKRDNRHISSVHWGASVSQRPCLACHLLNLF